MDQVSVGKNSQTIVINGSVDLKSAPTVFEQGVSLIESAEDAVLSCDLREVSQSSNSGLVVVLLGWLRFVQKHERTLLILNPPVFLVGLFELYGVEQIFSSK